MEDRDWRSQREDLASSYIFAHQPFQLICMCLQITGEYFGSVLCAEKIESDVEYSELQRQVIWYLF